MMVPNTSGTNVDGHPLENWLCTQITAKYKTRLEEGVTAEKYGHPLIKAHHF